MKSSLEDTSGFQAYHILLTREQHRRLRLVCTMLAVPMSEFLRRLISSDVDRRFVELGLDRVPVPHRPDREPERARRAAPTARTAK